MLPFFNSFYALEDNKKKVVKYYEKVDEHNVNQLAPAVQTKSAGLLPNLYQSHDGAKDHT
jgi:hypothetical protein